MPLLGDMIHLDIGYGRIAVRAPVRDARALVDEPLLVERDEYLAHCLRAAFIHRKALAVPVAGGADAAQLVHDAVAVFLFPVPDLLEELLAADLIARRPLVAELRLHLCLRSDAGMIAARNPDRIVAGHAVVADQYVLQRLIECMAHVELARDIRRRYDHAVRLLRLIYLSMEKLVAFPVFIPFFLKRLRVVHLRNIVRGLCLLLVV